jgi:tetratricopeptide (TPR) repeat protein
MNQALVTVLIASLVIAPAKTSPQRGAYRGGAAQGGAAQGAGAAAARGRSAPRTANAARYPGPANQPHPASRAAFGNRPTYHGGWYHGDWHGHWSHPYAYRPWGWYGGGFGWGFGLGLGVATIGAVAIGSPWGWGYYPYYNPYWVGPVGGVTYINYSQPIVVASPAVAAPQGAVEAGPAPADAAATNPSQDKALAIFDSARSMFKRGDYQMALAQANKAVALLPNDSLMHEFRGLCLFAMKDYQQSAAAVYAVLSIGPGWDAATVAGLYPSQSVYNDQLRALENYRNAHADSGSAHFLLAYHNMLAAHNDQAIAELRSVVELEPKDQLSAQLLKGLTSPALDRPPAELASGPELAPAAPVEAASLVGNWKADRSDGSKFELNLTEEKKFSWKFTQQDKKQQLKGTYTLSDNYLILTASGQNALVGQVALEPDDTLKFKLAGGSPADPGITFTR